MRPSLILALTLIPLLAACGGASSGKVASANVVITPAKPVLRQPQRRTPGVQILAIPGLEGVIGATSAELLRQFGAARLDVWEGDARKLQFSGTACVLDVYLYPPAAGREPQASYVDARRASDGQDVDRVACVSSLRQIVK